MTVRRLAALALTLGLGAVAAPAGAVDLSKEIAVLQGLDKVTGRVMTVEAPVGATIHFGTLDIIIRTCKKHPPEELPESAAFLDIWELKQGEPAVSLFRGWMFASSPALSALQHPVFDIWVMDCVDRGEKRGVKPGTAAPAPRPKDNPDEPAPQD